MPPYSVTRVNKVKCNLLWTWGKNNNKIHTSYKIKRKTNIRAKMNFLDL